MWQEKKDSDGPLLHQAIRNGNIEVVRLLINQRVNINEKDASSGSTPLHLAVKHCKLDILRLLLQFGAKSSINVKDKNSKTPILIAFDSNQRYQYGKTNAEVVKILIDAGANVNEKVQSNSSFYSHSLLHQAIEYNDENLVEIILQAGESFNEMSSGRSLLGTAIRCKVKSKIIEFLVNAGAGVSDKSEFQQVLDWEDFNPAKILILAGADVHTKSYNKSRTALHVAAVKNDVEMIKYLLARRADVNAKDSSGLTPFQCAALSNVGNSHWNAIQLLLSRVGVESNRSSYSTERSQSADNVNTKFFQLIFNKLDIIDKKINLMEKEETYRWNELQRKIGEIESRIGQAEYKVPAVKYIKKEM